MLSGGGMQPLDAEIITVHPRRTFAIAHGAADYFERVIVTIEADGLTGRGESAPADY
jgi:L-alanine-DL-glutamate epimerase-like enolase superfamily enzyme